MERLNIVACFGRTAGSVGNRPQTLTQLGVDRVVGRRIIGWKGCHGSYGMGGPGFFGVELEAMAQWPCEHLVLTLWGAPQWLLLDGRWIEAHPNQYHIQRPLSSNFGRNMTWDEVTPPLAGGTIERFELHDDSCQLVVRGPGGQHVIELPQDTSRLPVHGGSLDPRRWNPKEKVSDAWVVCDGELEC